MNFQPITITATPTRRFLIEDNNIVRRFTIPPVDTTSFNQILTKCVIILNIWENQVTGLEQHMIGQPPQRNPRIQLTTTASQIDWSEFQRQKENLESYLASLQPLADKFAQNIIHISQEEYDAIHNEDLAQALEISEHLPYDISPKPPLDPKTYQEQKQALEAYLASLQPLADKFTQNARHITQEEYNTIHNEELAKAIEESENLP